jgi:hypothetical protein
VRPETILAWFRQLAAQKYDSSKDRKAGRPGKTADIRELVLELARGNPGWGYTRIRDALRGLQVEIGRTTVANILAEAGIEPAPERNRKRTWKQFLTSHWETLYACDFFSVEVLGVFGTVRNMVFFFGERHLRHLINEFMGHYLTERHHQGIGSQIIRPKPSPSNDNAIPGEIGCRSRLGGLRGAPARSIRDLPLRQAGEWTRRDSSSAQGAAAIGVGVRLVVVQKAVVEKGPLFVSHVLEKGVERQDQVACDPPGVGLRADLDERAVQRLVLLEVPLVHSLGVRWCPATVRGECGQQLFLASIVRVQRIGEA